MATKGTRNLTLADVARRKDPSGKIATIVELLSEENEILQDMISKEANDGTNHKTTVRTGIPSGTWRKLYGGIQSTKSETAQVIDSCGMLEALPKIDADLIDKSTDRNGALMSEHVAHLEGMSQQIAQTLFYGDTAVYPERFMGLAPRYDNYLRASPDKTKSDYNVLAATGTESDNTSVWLVGWGDNACHTIYPNGSQAGLMSSNKGKLLTPADPGYGAGDFMAYVTHYKWDIGLSIRDWRSVGRLCNIDWSLLAAGTYTALVNDMIKLAERVKFKGGGRLVWYMNPQVKTYLRILSRTDTNVRLTFDTVEGHEVMSFDGVPIRVCEQILLTETALTQAS